MRNAIIVHGSTDKEEYYANKYPSMSNSHWIPWLQKQLLVNDVPAATPEIPQCYNLEYETWKREFERYDVTPETILVGHSCGGGFLVRWLSEHREVRVGKVVLVAPWINPDKDKEGGDDFFDFEIDPSLVFRTDGLMIYGSDNDRDAIQKSVQILREKIKDAGYREFTGYRHFITKHMGRVEFPELLEQVLS